MKLIRDAFNGVVFSGSIFRIFQVIRPSFRSRKSALEWYDNL